MTDLSCTYAPSDSHEKKYFDFLWDVANNRPPGSDPSGQGELGGAAAVGFLQRSGVDKGFLKQIWSFSTPGSTMNLQQFYVAMRFIAMIQSGEMPISKGTINRYYDAPLYSQTPNKSYCLF